MNSTCMTEVRIFSALKVWGPLYEQYNSIDSDVRARPYVKGWRYSRAAHLFILLGSTVYMYY
jgi:hypothetical protein